MRNGAAFVRHLTVVRATGRRTLLEEARARKDLEGERSPGRTGRTVAGNGHPALRPRERSNASKSASGEGNAQHIGTGNGTDAERGARSGGTARGQRPRQRGAAAIGGSSSRGVKRVAGKSSTFHERPPSGGGYVGARRRKRGEPQDWQRDATSPRPPSGGSRRGGAKPRGRNAMARVVPSSPKHAATRVGVDARRHVGEGGFERPDSKGGPSSDELSAQKAKANYARSGTFARIPRKEVGRPG